MEGELPQSSERKEHDTRGQPGEQNIQSDTAVELSGEASERDQAKEVYVQNCPPKSVAPPTGALTCEMSHYGMHAPLVAALRSLYVIMPVLIG